MDVVMTLLCVFVANAFIYKDVWFMRSIWITAVLAGLVLLVFYGITEPVQLLEMSILTSSFITVFVWTMFYMAELVKKNKYVPSVELTADDTFMDIYDNN